jgi:SAM-dependent methyltransferase
MPTGGRCTICAGPLALHLRGASEPLTPEALSPSRHAPGAHGDLYACRDCGTIQQPSLPGGASLHELYRGMADAAYLGEEAGRRRTAQRLLDLLSRHLPSGARLLDVGCGPGLLLDEARRRGLRGVGLELSAASARHAREALGLDVREVSLEQLDPTERFDAIVLADVLEHLDDPVAAIEECAARLGEGGVLCVVTPDPASPAARLAGRRWWGYLPGHANLLPRRTLREVITATGLVISHDAGLVRSFSLRRWVVGLAERLGPLARLTRALPPGPMLSLSLGDERVVLAHRVAVRRPERPLVRPRGAPRSVHVVLPAYRAERTVARVARHLPVTAADRALLVDDASDDATVDIALAEGLEVLRHPVNRGYGANQKTCYTRAIHDGADVVVMVHADDQYDPALVAEMVRPVVEGRADAVMGSRMLRDRTIAGGMPRWKWLGNRLLTAIENRAFHRSWSEYHTGYRAFSTDLLRSIAFLRNDDGFVFDQQVFAQLVASGARVVELPIPTRYFHEASSVSFPTSVGYALRTLAVLARFRLHASGRRAWPLLRPPATPWRRERPEERPRRQEREMEEPERATA